MSIQFPSLAVALALACGCASGPAASTVALPDADAALVASFRERVDNYMELRDEAAGDELPLDEPADPARIRAAQAALAARIRAARPNARHGDIFAPDIRVYFRSALAPELRGEQGSDVRARLRDDAPARGAVPLEVNAVYPPGVPFAATPYPLLLSLPALPLGLEYRMVGRDLILLDQAANLIVDYIRNAIPARAPA